MSGKAAALAALAVILVAPAAETVASDPSRPAALGRLLAAIDDERLVEAEGMLRLELENPAAPPAFRFLLGRVLHLTSRYGEAADELGRAVALRPDRALWWRELAAVESRRGRCLQALAALDRALALAPDAQTRHERALCWIELGDPESARGELAAAIVLDPTHRASLERLGEIELDRGDLERAGELLRRALALDERRIEARILVARLELEAGDGASARARLEEVLREVPAQPTALYLLARAVAAAGDEAAARPLYERFSAASAELERLEAALQAARLDPRDPSRRIDAGRGLIRAGRYAEARAELTAAGRLAPLPEIYRRWLAAPPSIDIPGESHTP